MSFSSSFGTSGRPSVPPLEVRLTRNGIHESLHRVHAVVCDQRGRVLMRAGDPQKLSFIRSALKPFQAQVFVASGTADAAGAEHWDVDGVDDLRDQHHRPDLTGVTAGLRPLRDDDVDARGLVPFGVLRPSGEGADQSALPCGHVCFSSFPAPA